MYNLNKGQYLNHDRKKSLYRDLTFMLGLWSVHLYTTYSQIYRVYIKESNKRCAPHLSCLLTAIAYFSIQHVIIPVAKRAHYFIPLSTYQFDYPKSRRSPEVVQNSIELVLKVERNLEPSQLEVQWLKYSACDWMQILLIEEAKIRLKWISRSHRSLLDRWYLKTNTTVTNLSTSVYVKTLHSDDAYFKLILFFLTYKRSKVY